jgi:hypothetical protein
MPPKKVNKVEVGSANLEPKEEFVQQELFEVERMEEISIKDLNSVPEMHDPTWTSYAMSFLAQDEQYSGNPKADGLRRLVELLIGPIVQQDTQLLNYPQYGETEHHKNSATARSVIAVKNRKTGEITTASAVADASGVSCSHPYNKFMSSIAETRAEGRVYKKILRLQNVVTSDEISHEAANDVASDGINNNQVEGIDALCRKINMNIQKGVEKMVGNKLRGIRMLSKEQAIQFLEICHKIQNKELSLSAENSGYDPDWRNYFG